ncbi:MAG TPA: LptF/LptG family permease [Cyclobacteriaceae bacterium]|nr:LptF/LptG family permease [Cyclobacteriaceae bacterium]
MKLLDKYIFGKILATFFFVLLILVAIIVVIDLTEKVDKFTANNLSTATILGYYLDFVPWIAGLISPIIAFIAIVYVTGRLAAHSEIIAMLSSGVSFPRLLLPYFFAATIIAGITFMLNGWVIPISNKARLEFELTYLKSKQFYGDRQNIFMQVEHNVIMFIQNYNNQNNTGYQFTLEKFDDKNRLVEKLWAQQISWDTTKHTWHLKIWKRKFVDSLFLARNNPSMFDLRTTGTDMDTALNIKPVDFENIEGQYDGMTIPELTDHIKKLKFRGATGVETYEVERHIRFAAPFTIFVLVFMGVLVSARKSRGGTGYQIVMGFILAFVFLIFFLLTRTFAETGALPPFIAAWLPNITFGIIAAFMYRYVPR